ncbi:MAG: amino acid racemase [Candidatus Paceibacterota bacterium]
MSQLVNPNKSIGVLGGMGPAATAEFFHLLVKYAQELHGAVQDTDFPAMFIYNLPLSGFDETGVCDEELVKTQLVAGIKELSKFDCGLICIPCNTVHIFFEEMQAATPVPIVSIVEAVIDEVVLLECGKVGILSSETTRTTGLYESALTRRGIEYVSVSELEQEKINEVIHRVMSGRQDETDISSLLSICARMEKEGVEALVLGCTELPLAFNQKNITLPVVSSLDALAKAVLGRVYGTTPV